MTIEFIRLLHSLPLLCFPLLVRWLMCGMNFLYCAFKIPGGKQGEILIARCVLLKEQQHSAEDQGLRMGKSITYLFSQNRKLKDIIPFSPCLDFTVDSVFLSFRSRLQIAKLRGRKWRVGDKFAVGQPCLLSLFFCSNTVERGKKFPLEDMLLLMDTMHTRRHKKKKRRENEMLVKHEFSAKNGCEREKKKKEKEFIACARYVAGKKKSELLPFVPLYLLQDALCQQLKLFEHKLKAS